jgi:hypothetical protein
MGIKKIADSIIIRVGGGIREIRREPLETETQEAFLAEADFEQGEETHPFGVENGSDRGIGPDKVSR